MDKFFKRNSSSAGMTLFELLLISVVIGIIATLGLTSWFKFLNEQRLKQANEAIDLVIRTTQNFAKQSNQTYTVQFRMSNNVPQYASYPSNTSSSEISWQNLLSDANNITLSLSHGDSVVFNYDGAISSSSLIRAGEKITLRLADASSNAQYCVIVQTLLGSLKSGQDTECSQS